MPNRPTGLQGTGRAPTTCLHLPTGAQGGGSQGSALALEGRVIELWCGKEPGTARLAAHIKLMLRLLSILPLQQSLFATHHDHFPTRNITDYLNAGASLRCATGTRGVAAAASRQLLAASQSRRPVNSPGRCCWTACTSTLASASPASRWASEGRGSRQKTVLADVGRVDRALVPCPGAHTAHRSSNCELL